MTKDLLKEYYHRWCEHPGCTVHTMTRYAGRHFYCTGHRLLGPITKAVEEAQVGRVEKSKPLSVPIAFSLKDE